MEDAGLLSRNKDSTQEGIGTGFVDAWEFRTGQCIRLNGNLESAEGIITKRLRLVGNGRMYEIFKIFDDDGDFGYVSESSVSSVQYGGRCCAECPLSLSSICPRKRMQ
jgi:hypothetical protein